MAAARFPKFGIAGSSWVATPLIYLRAGKKSGCFSRRERRGLSLDRVRFNGLRFSCRFSNSRPGCVSPSLRLFWNLEKGIARCGKIGQGAGAEEYMVARGEAGCGSRLKSAAALLGQASHGNRSARRNIRSRR